jgi:hypothetical protein
MAGSVQLGCACNCIDFRGWHCSVVGLVPLRMRFLGMGWFSRFQPPPCLACLARGPCWQVSVWCAVVGWGLWVGGYAVCVDWGDVCVCWVSFLAAWVRVWWVFEWYCFELIPLWGVRGSRHTVVDQAEPQSSTLWRLSESV